MTRLTCRDVIALLIEYLEHELRVDRREHFEAHLSRCDDCVAYIRHYEQTIRLAKNAFD